MTDYKLKTKTPAWQEHPRCSLEISLLTTKFDGNKLKATIEWVNRHFEACTINLADTLYRHNLAGTPHESPTQVARRLGDEWLFRNNEILEFLTVPYQIIRWDSFLNHPEFASIQSYFAKLYQTDQIFKDLVDQDARMFVARGESNRSMQNSVDFILEELAGDELHSRMYKYVYVYPGTPLSVQNYINEKNPSISFNKTKIIKVDFRRRHSPQLCAA
ncbi:MAG: hypothetical protein CMJ41_03245 [Phycisphaerae bacterium]|nr:hypothetical protein [Phycisphaerae bacterium]HAI13474.1 hypothetical protein [Phycisphaerales bacterium]|tara:strand:+ start:781 stop:1431 length:651 start_codon:yes stop_codon:yes gene_type:complete